VKILILILFILTSFPTFSDSHLDFSLSDFCYQSPKVQVRDDTYFFPNQEKGITGISICVYKDNFGQYRSKGKLKNGKMDGKWISWYKNGQKEMEGNVNSVLSEGTFIYWHKEGEKWKEENITNGGKDNKITYWINGNKSEEKYFEGDTLVKRHTWRENGNKWKQLNFKNGERHGKRITWNKDGFKSEENYKNGFREGKTTAWYPNGQIFLERNYTNNTQEGKETYWHENGSIKSEKYFKNGKCISGCDKQSI